MGLNVMGRVALAACAVMALAATEAKAFCIYNYSSYPMKITQSVDEYGNFLRAGMDKVVPSRGGKECCNWQDRDCNPGGERTSKVYFRHYVYNAINNDIGNYRCNEQWLALELQAGGWAEIYDDPGNRWGLKCVTYRAN
ncbi:hypothetical protein ACM64Y_08275 [Novispirillum sp. DQ9]|uniref:hypothetical protein n=1 Tax=Novispirillum sp. DQ9 TaxID=3398612 RepID=UPI003C7E0CFC